MNSSRGADVAVSYWRERNAEIDFVLSAGKKITAVEVKSGMIKVTLNGMDLFRRKFPSSRVMLVGGGGIGIGEFLSMRIEDMI